jgi:hypothetical protein
MSCALLSDITFAGGRPAAEAAAQAQPPIGFTLLVFCKGPSACLPFFGEWSPLRGDELISTQDTEIHVHLILRAVLASIPGAVIFPYHGT